jgi:hypothetical protein
VTNRDGRVPAALRALGAARANMLVIAVAYGIFALSLLFQPARWQQTPAYANLLAILPQQAWGGAFTAVCALLAAAAVLPGRRWLPVPALAAGVAITTFWSAAFIIRWATSPDTTPVTWVSWAVFDLILLRALTPGNGTGRGSRG